MTSPQRECFLPFLCHICFHSLIFTIVFSSFLQIRVRAKVLALLTTIVEETTTKTPARFAVISDFLAEFHGGESSSGLSLATILQRRTSDEKSAVRKGGLSLIKAVIVFVMRKIATTEQELQPKEIQALLNTVEERSADPVMTIRKQTLEIMTELVTLFPTSALLLAKWQRTIFPAITDRETAIQDYCVSCVNAVLIHQPRESESDRLWASIAQLENNNLKYFQRICGGLAQKGHLDKPFVASLTSAATSSWTNVGAWVLLAEVTHHAPSLVPPKQLLELWTQLQKAAPSTRVSSCYLRVICSIADKIAPQEATRITQSLQERLQTLSTDVSLIATSIELLKKLCGADQTKKQQKAGSARGGALEKWCQETNGAFEKRLASLVMQEGADKQQQLAEETISRCLFTIGEIYQISPFKFSERLLTCLQAIVASPALALTATAEQVTATVATFPPSVRAQGLITLGKVSLQDEDFAKRFISALAREMKESDDAIIRNNAMMILCDLCVRYTSIVDKYVVAIASCLHDPHELVRRQTLTMLTRMLQEDYIKWKGSLFFQFITSVADDSRDIRQFGEYCLVHLLVNKQPAMLFNNFIDSITYLNNYSPKKSADRITTSLGDQERGFAGFAGPENERKRRLVYKFLLDNMSDEHKFQLSYKLCVETLASVVETQIDINDPAGAAVTADVLYVLSSQEIKLTAQQKAAKNKEDEEEETLDEALANAKSKVLTKISKKNNIENMIPAVIELKHYLEDHRSPLLKNLMAFLCSLVKDFRVEMEDLMASDRQLANEIEFDIRQYEKQRTPIVSRMLPRTTAPAGSPLQQFAAAQAQSSPFKSPRAPASATKPSVAAALVKAPGTPVFKTPSKVTKPGVAVTPRTLNLSMISPVLARSVEKSFQVIHMKTPEISPSLAAGSEALMKQSTPGRSSLPANIVLPSPSSTKARGITRLRSWNISSPAPKEVALERKRTRDDEDELEKENESESGSQDISLEDSIDEILTLSTKKTKLTAASRVN